MSFAMDSRSKGYRDDPDTCLACGRSIDDGELCTLCYVREDGAYREIGGESG